MAVEQAPAYQWYVKDWRSSRKVQRMSFKEQGMYRAMLDEQWERVSLPGDPASMARLIGGTVKEWTRSWLVLIANFTILPDGRLQNERLERERDKQRKRQEKGKTGGEASGAARLNPTPIMVEPPADGGSTNDYEVAKHAGARLLLPLPLQIAVAGAGASAVAPPPPTARSKRPIFVGQRLTVFEWMLDELLKLLDPHGETFGLDEWFDTLDKRCLARGEIPPDRDNGAWLKAATLTEAQRRGLLLRVATAPGANAVADDAAWDAIAKAGPSERALRSLKGAR